MAKTVIPTTTTESAIFQDRVNRRLRHSSGNPNGPTTMKINGNTIHGLSHHAAPVLLDKLELAIPAVGAPQ
jgi:hypothetical protein